MASTSFAAAFNAAISGGLTVAHSNTSAGGARSIDLKSSGKYYFEVTLTTLVGTSTGIGLLQACFGCADLVSGANVGTVVIYKGSGNIWSNGSSSGKSLGALANGDIIGIAIDLDGRNVWFRKAPSGNWNGNASYDPATASGGASCSSLPDGAAPAIGYTSSGNSTETVTANFGDTSFSGSVPSGFTAGWPSNAAASAGVSRARAPGGV